MLADARAGENARSFGRQIDGIWHTGVVVYGSEYFFGGGGIESCPPAGTVLGQPDRIEEMGTTQIPFDMFMQYLAELSNSTFRPECYHLLDHNCNKFSSELSQFLTGKDIPAAITGLPAEVMSTPFGQMIRPMLDAMTVQPSGGHNVFNTTTQNNTKTKDSKTSSNNSNSKSQPSSTSQTKMGGDSMQSEIKLLKKWAWYEDEKKPKTYRETVEQMLASEGSDLIQLQGHFDSTYKTIEEIIDIVKHKPNSTTLDFQHLKTLADHITTESHSESSRHFSIRLLSLCILQENVPLTSGSTSPVLRVVSNYHTLPSRCKSLFLQLATNALSTPDTYRLCTMDDTSLFTTIIDALLLADQDTEFYQHMSTAVYNISLYCRNEEQCVDLTSAILEHMQKQRSVETVVNLLTTLLRFMNKFELVRAVVMTMDVDWTSLTSLSPHISHLVDVIKSVIE